MTPTPKAAYECKVFINQSILHSLKTDDPSSPDKPRPSLVGAVDQGTSSSRFLLVTSDGKILSTAQVEFEQSFPTSSPHNPPGSSCAGWHEQDPFAIWDSVATCVSRTFEELFGWGLDLWTSSPPRAVGIANQRETTVCWNDRTGRLYYDAIVWDDTRTATVAETIVSENSPPTGVDAARPDPGRRGARDALRSKTGLPVASYFSGTKVRWLIDNIPRLRSDLTSETERPHVRFGTVDAWLTYMLTGYARTVAEMDTNERLAHEGGVFKTDVSNASRWLFVDLEKMDWDESLLSAVCGGSDCWKDSKVGRTIPAATALPKIVPSSDETIGTICGIPCPNLENKLALENVVIGSILGDQQAALFGQSCFRPGEAKCTYGTGLFLMMNTGEKPTSSTRGLLTTVAYQIAGKEPVYALEGSVAFSGSTIGWLRDRLELIKSASETESLALAVPSNENMYLVPAFSGLFAPHWRPDARGCIVGLTASHTKAHIVRAALESSAYQTREVFDAMVLDSDVRLKEMRVDGGATANKFLMQFTSDMLAVPVIRPEFLETTVSRCMLYVD
jgi:glycerol kinase